MVRKKPDADLTRETRKKSLTARLRMPAGKRGSRQMQANLEALPDFQAFSILLGRAAESSSRTRCEVGFSYALPIKDTKPDWSRATWSDLIVGGADEINLAHDPTAQYFSHVRNHLPLVMLHFHPSGRLGFSRNDCLLANQVIQECQRLFGQATQAWHPIFAVAVLPTQQSIDVLLVQRQEAGKFMQFSEVAQNYDAKAWLQAPAFYAAILQFDLQSGKAQLRAISDDTGVRIPLR